MSHPSTPEAMNYPSAPEAMGYPSAPETQPPRPSGALLRRILTWTAAALLFTGTATGIGYALTHTERSDLPLLATESDGRWDYPGLKLPALPHGAPAPLDDKANPAGIHHVTDLRRLLLPQPAGAKPDTDAAAAKIKDGWISPADFTAVYAKDEREAVRQMLTDDAVRHVAARAWTMPDGTRTGIYLLRFNTGALAGHFYDEVLTGGVSAGRELAEAPNTVLDESWPTKARLDGVDLYVYDEEKPYGATHARQAYVVAGDTIALVVQSRAGGAAKVPFQQTLALQQQLLG
ncbi:hypothetical protein ACFQLX_10845 [Streptomyces polyrhachis]|uniref:Uncharacterized protein n=1 Tax=Streptomyces polyrhachis TaxID=1282885 RepID=A0ABW2GD53_9ACTN